MASLFARHAVQDYDRWLEGYKSTGELRSQHGCKADRIWRAADKPNEVLTLYEFSSVEEARAFIASPLFQVAMEKAGAGYAQQIEYFQEA